MNPRYEKNESQENYLEAILRILAEKGYCRSVDIADHLAVAKPSVSTAMRKLLEKEFIQMDGSKFIRLTSAGQRLAEEVYARHRFFKKCLVAAGVEEGIAEEEACALEHAISEDSFRKLVKYAGAVAD